MVIFSAAIFPSYATFAAAPSDDADEHSTIHFSPKLWLQAVKAGSNDSNDWSRTGMLKELLSKTKLEGLERRKVIELLGEPQRSDAVMPSNVHRTIVDFYRLSQKNDQHFRVEYDSYHKALSSYFEPTPLVVPKYMAQGKAVTLLSISQLNTFLSRRSEEDVRKMKVEDIERELGQPAKNWKDSSLSGGRQRHWLTYMYFLSPDEREAFIVTFDGDANHVYEYRSVKLI